MKPVITEKEHIIHYYEVDYKQRALVSSIMNYFCDAAVYQSQILNMSLDYLKEKHIGWVLYKWDINIKRYPMFGEKVIVRTMPHSLRRFYAYRKFEVIDLKGETIITANSVWFLIDTDRRKPKKIPLEIYNAYGIEYDMNKTLNIDKIHDLQEIDSEKMFNVRYSDIDTNKHVNNVKYYSWAIETIPKDIILNYNLRNVKVEYKKETTYGKCVKALTEIREQEENIICIHKIVDNDENELAFLETVWEK